MSIFGNNNGNTYTNTTQALKADGEFKLFVESKIQDGSCDKYTGYTDSKIITKGTWGEKSNDKVVKGFALSTDMDKIKLYAKRTKVKHGGSAVNILDKDEVTPTMLKGKGKHVDLNKFKKK